MQIPGASGVLQDVTGCAPAIDTASIITKLASVREAHELPGGSLVGDLQGGLTFSDAVAAELEARSVNGWREVRCAGGEIWTVIRLDD